MFSNFGVLSDVRFLIEHQPKVLVLLDKGDSSDFFEVLLVEGPVHDKDSTLLGADLHVLGGAPAFDDLDDPLGLVEGSDNN